MDVECNGCRPSFLLPASFSLTHLLLSTIISFGLCSAPVSLSRACPVLPYLKGGKVFRAARRVKVPRLDARELRNVVRHVLSVLNVIIHHRDAFQVARAAHHADTRYGHVRRFQRVFLTSAEVSKKEHRRVQSTR